MTVVSHLVVFPLKKTIGLLVGLEKKFKTLFNAILLKFSSFYEYFLH